jgi:hypothetical protein
VSSSLSSSLNSTYNNCYVVFCNKRIFKECDMEVNREAAETVYAAYFKRLAIEVLLN